MNDRLQGGYTLLELLIAITITGILLLVAGDLVARTIGDADRIYSQTVVQTNTQTAVEAVARQIEASSSVLPSNSQPDAHGPNGDQYGWTAASGNSATLILAVPSHDINGNLLYADGLHTTLYTDNYIYYLEPTTHQLLRRTIANSVSGNGSRSTCPTALASSACPADKLIIENVANLATQYLNHTGQPVADPTGTEAVQYTVTQSITSGRRTIQGKYSTIATLRNR